MLSVVLFRALLIATPFVVWFIWRDWARRNGREMGATPWAWLCAAGGVLFAASLFLTPLFSDTHHPGAYTPAKLQPDGSVSPGRLEEQ